MVTILWFGLALVIPALLLLAGSAPFLILPTIVYGFGLGLLTWLDRRSAGGPDQFRIARRHDQKLSLGVSNTITLQIETRTRRAFALTLQDEPPLDFIVIDSATATLMAAPDQSLEHSYHVLPRQRGDYEFGNINLRWTGPLRLYVRQTTLPAIESVKVYPNISEVRRYELLVRRHELFEMGLRTVRQRDEGTVFESLRDYTPDDPYRAINWKATARRGKPISTVYEPERNQRIAIALDVGRMMRSAIRVRDTSGIALNMAKVDFVINSILLLSYVASRKGDQVGLLVFADDIKQFVPPEAGSAQFHKLLEVMYALGSEPVEADYARAINYLRAKQKKRALVVLFTDLGGARATDTLRAYMPRLAPQHLPLLVTIRDPSLDREAEQTIVDSDTVYRRIVAEQLIEERRLLLDYLSRSGVLTLDVDADHLSASVVNRYLQVKGRLAV
ncbi:MAG TPA: DUF58 domain-containing protein [Aggregatilineales bacterium]|nr:DUF58 domain-containing protein [Aggregatilineales bacterium]